MFFLNDCEESLRNLKRFNSYEVEQLCRLKALELLAGYDSIRAAGSPYEEVVSNVEVPVYKHSLPMKTFREILKKKTGEFSGLSIDIQNSKELSNLVDFMSAEYRKGRKEGGGRLY
jgi:hypothetical protein